MGTLLSTAFSDLRVLTGNDDAVLGVELMPDTRCALLLHTAVMTLPAYVYDAPKVVVNTEAGTIFISTDPTAELNTTLFELIKHIAAHKYFTGIANKALMAEMFSAIQSLADSYTGIAQSAGT